MKTMKKITMMLMVVIMLAAFSMPVFAADEDHAAVEAVEVVETEGQDATGDKALAAGLAIGLAAAAGAIAMGIAIGKSVEGIARQPEAEGKIRTSLMLGLVFVETAVIYALIVAILIVFVL